MQRKVCNPIHDQKNQLIFNSVLTYVILHVITVFLLIHEEPTFHGVTEKKKTDPGESGNAFDDVVNHFQRNLSLLNGKNWMREMRAVICV